MLSDQKIAEYLVQKALKEMHRGKWQAARFLAQRAVSLAPGLEEPLLILAAVADPRASLAYYREALRINPDSPRARRGMHAAETQLQRTAGVKPEQQRVSLRSARKNQVQLVKRLGMVLGPTLLVVVILAGIFVLFQNSSVQGKENVLMEQQILAALETSAATATADFPSPTAILPSPTPLIIAVPPATASPTQKPSPQPTKTTVVLKAPAVPLGGPPSGGKRILVSLGEQHLYAYQGDTLIYSFTISSGAGHSTSPGTFTILDKSPDAWSDPWGFWMPDWMGIYWVGDEEDGIHGLPVLPDGSTLWGDQIGTPVSYGCVVLDTEEARTLYNWADVGTQVEIVN